MILKRTAEPDGLPIVWETKLQDFLRVRSSQQTLVEDLITVATEYAESVTWRALLTQEFKLIFNDCFPYYPKRKDPCEIQIPKGVVQSIDSIDYIDSEGVEQTLVEGTDYEIMLDSTPPTVRPLAGKSWPNTKAVYGAASISFTAGYGDADAVQAKAAEIVSAMKRYISDLLENPGTQILTVGGGRQLPPGSSAVNTMLIRNRAWVKC